MPRFLLQIQRPAFSRNVPSAPDIAYVPVEADTYRQARQKGIQKAAEYGKAARLQTISLIEVKGG